MLEKFVAYQLARKVYFACRNLKVRSHVKDQLLKASSSIPLNLAEGSARRTKADQVRFYSIAFGSLRECQAILDIEEVEDPALLRLTDDLAAILYSLTRPSKTDPEDKQTRTGLPNQATGPEQPQTETDSDAP